MDLQSSGYWIAPAALALSVLAARTFARRLALSRAKHRSLAGHARWSRRLARFIPYYEYDEERIFKVDGAPPEVESRRQAAFSRLSAQYAARYPVTRRRTQVLTQAVSDLQFTSAYRVPFQFSKFVRAQLGAGTLVSKSHDVMVEDLDGNEHFDLTGSYGVNVFGYDFYKECMQAGAAHVADLGPVLGAYHPVIEYNVARLREISGLDEISFHMSGTEAVMQAVRLARYHTRRTHLVRFCGAYHGWWGDVQPGVGNPITAHETYTLKEMAQETLHVLSTRDDIACVLVNPLQALHPNQAAPGDSSLLDSSRRADFDRVAYTKWLLDLRAVCSRRDIVLIFDEVFVGFRIAAGGAQEYFGIQADMVTYGKTLGGGYPVGVVCGRANLMRRFNAERPADVCFARGTFNSHPYVMGAMHEFLRRLQSNPIRSLYQNLDDTWNARASHLNLLLEQANLPVRVANLSSIWTVYYIRPCAYNWMLQYYLRLHGLALSWVGTGRLIFSLNFTDRDFLSVSERFLAAAREMMDDGWWWAPDGLTDRDIKRRILLEMIRSRFTARKRQPAATAGAPAHPSA